MKLRRVKTSRAKRNLTLRSQQKASTSYLGNRSTNNLQTSLYCDYKFDEVHEHDYIPFCNERDSMGNLLFSPKSTSRIKRNYIFPNNPKIEGFERNKEEIGLVQPLYKTQDYFYKAPKPEHNYTMYDSIPNKKNINP